MLHDITGPHLPIVISNKYTITIRNKFDTLQETSKRHTSNNDYQNFVTAHIEVAAECISTKLRAKSGVSWESTAVREK